MVVEHARHGDRDLLGAEVLALERLESVPALLGRLDRDGGVCVRQVGARVGRIPLEIEEGDHADDGGRADELGDERVHPTTP